MKQFSPSAASIPPKERVLRTLSYTRKAVDGLEEFLLSQKGEDVPTWVLDRINASASALGAALSFVSYRNAVVEPKKAEKGKV